MTALRLHGDAIAARAMGLDFATCLWPTAAPAWLEDALAVGLADRGRYPHEDVARAAIAARHGRQPDEVLLLNGACEAFWLLAHGLRPEHAACVHPSFTEPEVALTAAGAHVVRVALEPGSWSLDPSRVPERAEVVVVGNPNNPTGTLLSPAALAALARDDRTLVVDESFIELTEADGSASLAGRTDLHGLVVVRSLTKLYALAGVRAGYLLASAELVRRLAGQRQPWSVNALACRVLAAAAGDPSTPRRVAAEVATSRRALTAALSTFSGKLRLWPSTANFLLLELEDAPAIIGELLAREILVRPAASFPGLGEQHVRIAVRPMRDNSLLLAALTEVLT